MYFNEAGLKELSDFLRVQQSLGTRKELQKELQERLSQECPIREVAPLHGWRVFWYFQQQKVCACTVCVYFIVCLLHRVVDGGICKGGDEEECASGAGCDWSVVDVPHERYGVEQEGGAGHRAGSQTPQGTATPPPPHAGTSPPSTTILTVLDHK